MIKKLSIRKLSVVFIMSIAVSGFSWSQEIDDFEDMFKNGEHKELINSLESFGVDNFSAEHFELYVSSLTTQDLDDAEDAANLAIKTFPKNPDMFLMHASVMGDQAQDSIFSALGYAEKALNSLQTAVELSPNVPKYRNALISFYLMAPSIAGGDKALALEQAKEVLRLDKISGALSMSAVLLSDDKPDEAIASLTKVLEEHPNSIKLNQRLAGIYASNEQFEKSIDTYITTVELDPKTDLPDTASADEINDDLESQSILLLGSHYQIGRVALVSKLRIQDGIKHLNIYKEQYQQTTLSVNGLPTLTWVDLRIAGLMHANNQHQEAKNVLDTLKLEENDQMKKIYKSLRKSVKKSLKN